MGLETHTFPTNVQFKDDEATTSSGKSTKKFGGVKTGRGYDAKKQWKSEKFGYGGKKKGSKRNDKERCVIMWCAVVYSRSYSCSLCQLHLTSKCRVVFGL